MFLEPKPVPLTDQAGVTRNFVIHKIPAVPMREIVAKYPVSNMPKVGEYEVSKEIMLKLMSYVGVETSSGNLQMLSSEALINNHCGDWEVLAKLEWAALQYNVSFLKTGVASASLTGWMTSAAPKLLSILTALFPHLSQTEKQPSTN